MDSPSRRARVAAGIVTAMMGLLAAVRPGLGYAATSADSANPACRPTSILVNPCRPWLGASANNYPQVQASLRPQITYHEQRIGRLVDIVHAYNGPGTTLTADETYFATRPDTMLYLNWRPTLTWALANGSDAATNASIDAMAQSIEALGSTKIFLAVYHEPETGVSGTPVGCTSPGPGTAGSTGDYRAMWKNVRARFDALGVSNVVWVMNYLSYAPYRCMDADLWPGNKLVDWVAFDTYGTGAQPNFDTNVGSMYDFLNSTSTSAHNYASKPYALAEWGIHGATVTPQQTYDYSDQAKAAVEGDVFPNIRAYMVFDNVGPDGTENRVGYQYGGVADPVRQQHYNAFAASSAFVDPPPDTTAPSVPKRLVGSVVGTTVHLSWRASTDNVAVTGYDVLRDGVMIGHTARTTYADTTGHQGTAYTYAIQAYDAAGNVSGSSGAVTETVHDATKPSRPLNLTGRSTKARKVTLNWSASSDNIAVTRYRVYRGSTRLATVGGSTLTYKATGLTSGRSYTFKVQAVDAAGNASRRSAGVTVKVK